MYIYKMSTYFIDIDGTIVKNLSCNELELIYKDSTYIEELLYGVEHFFKTRKEDDKIFFTTARSEKYREFTERTLKYYGIKYSQIIMDLPMGPRYLINDSPNILYNKAIGINLLRDSGFGDTFIFESEF